MDPAKVGGEVLAWCTSCKQMKDHVIVAMAEDRPAKVECMGCGKQHLYRAQPPGVARARAAKRTAAVKPPTPAPDDLEAILNGRQGEARTYSPNQVYVIGDIVSHPSFGTGLVLSLPAAQKLEVAFRSGRKLLVHERGHTAPSTLPTPRRSFEDERGPRVTDAPPRSAADKVEGEG